MKTMLFLLASTIRDLSLSKEATQTLVSYLEDRKLTQQSCKINFFRIRDKEVVPFLDIQSFLLSCKETTRVLMKLDFKEYIPDNWILSIGSSK